LNLSNLHDLTPALQRHFQSRQAVVIAITHEDMYIPGFGRQYAFRYRAADRLAVVSTARMERGCLGLFTASEERRISRL
jgi:predicted Zn-dependent protease